MQTSTLKQADSVSDTCTDTDTDTSTDTDTHHTHRHTYKDEYVHIKAKGPIGKIDNLLKLLSK